MTSNTSDSDSHQTQLDAIIIGAGFAGIYATYSLREKLGLKVKTFEAGGDVGGTWYWNRYPGARCDIESYHYSYSFSEELQQEWQWSERFAAQPEILAYLNHVADRFDLRNSMVMNTRIVGAKFDEAACHWVVDTDDGNTQTARYLVSGAGVLSASTLPDVEGINDFSGAVYLTAKWPQQEIDFSGKRVAVIGTGASGIQVITEVAKQAKHLTVFQRTPNYAAPIRNRPNTEQDEREFKQHYPQIRRDARNSFLGVNYPGMLPSALAVSDEERHQQYERAYAAGGFEMFAGSFGDLITNQEANDTAAEFMREKIRQRVDDPAVADMLTPKNYAYVTKRPPLETDYYETYNRSNVTLVDIRATPIEEITPNGIRTSAGDTELDVIIYATGFDAMTGPLLRINPRGESINLADHWAEGPRTNLGLTVHGLPNFFAITGPQSPSVLYNMPLAIEDHIDWLTDCISYMQEHGYQRIESTAEAEDNWVRHSAEIADATLFTGTDSWYIGANIPGKPRVFLVYVGGAANYRQICAEVAQKGYEGFLLS
ncbi:MAG: NAD(P)/FAD-dependent oxidoreductase [Immundisolibacteraceae bacterium]|nr:NAD(P)/FAD-dependent oxidoreductase [Immundisolibacteraceae bacterium]